MAISKSPSLPSLKILLILVCVFQLMWMHAGGRDRENKIPEGK